jgi:hypothetical protein
MSMRKNRARLHKNSVLFCDHSWCPVRYNFYIQIQIQCFNVMSPILQQRRFQFRVKPVG